MSTCVACKHVDALQRLPKFLNGVPKVIHQTWKTEKVPKHWLPSLNNWTSLHPDWHHVLWTDADIEAYIRAMHPSDWSIFEGLEGIQRVDLFRYYVLRDFGGVYCDLDIMPVKAIDEAIASSPLHVGLVPSANSWGVYTNAFMVSDTSPEAQAFWTSVIQHVTDFPHGPLDVLALGLRHTEIMASTGPLALTRCASEAHVPVTVLPRALWNPYDLSVAGLHGDQDKPESLVRILEGSSWHAMDSTALSFVHTHRKPIMGLVILGIAYFVITASIVRQKLSSLRKALRRRFNK